jgi:hypothetical protein
MSQLLKRNVVSLRREWRLFDKDNSSAEVFLALVERMIDVGEFLLAHDVAKAGLKIHKKQLMLCAKQALHY